MSLEKKVVSSVPEHDLELGQVVWDFMKMNHQLKDADVTVCLGSIDMLPAEKAAELYLNKWTAHILFSGKGGRHAEELNTTEARMLGDIAVQKGVNPEEILYEEDSTNTSQNISFSRNLLERAGIYAKRIIAVHMPSSGRRDYGTIRKVWPDLEVIFASPDVPFREYHKRGFQGKLSQKQVIGDMLGDFQRTFLVYPQKGFMIDQNKDMTPEAKDAYNGLVKTGQYEEQLIQDAEKLLK